MNRKKVLIVEDNEINRAMLVEIMSADYNVLEAENGQKALDVLDHYGNGISLILLDVHMPVMDGYAFLNRIKGDANLSAIPVIVMTQGSSEEDELAALNHGATDFVPKPYNPQVILHRAASLIKLRETAAMVNILQYDHLTGLYSREYFYQRVREQLDDDPDGEYCIVCSNIENFKLVNDVFGMNDGDRILKEIAETTKRAIGTSGFCGRFGADRFLCFQKRDKEQLDRQNFLNLIGKEPPQSLKYIVIRWGIYEITDRSVPVDQMCDRAFLAADSIKNKYQEFFAVYDDSIRSQLIREQIITASMDTALRERQIDVYLQPKYSLKNNCMIGAEALVRWHHPELGFLSPGEFIPLFEKNGFIGKLDHYVRETVCARLCEWKDKGYPIVPVSVNISRADVFQENLAESILALTREYGVEPEYLHLEITESAYADNLGQIINIVDEFRRMGFIVEMDDFGSGYSSFNMFSRMPLDIIKLDMQFVQNETSKPAEQSVLGDIINMAHRMRIEVVAEGVENREQMDRLQDVNCDYIQGYFLAKPMPVSEFEELLKAAPEQEDCYGIANRRNDTSRDTLLVIDEDAEYRQMVQASFLRKYTVQEVKNAEDALLLFGTDSGEKIAAVILSMTLPNDGASVIMNVMRHDPILREVPILAAIPNGDCMKAHPLALEADDFLCKHHPMFDLNRRIQRLVDIAGFRNRENALLDAAKRDPFTDLLNRRGYIEALADLRSEDMPVALCLFDLDDLKKVNDTQGHIMGDKMLRCLSDLLKEKTSPSDIMCRYGGDEFIVIMKNADSAEAVTEKCEDICRTFRECTEKEGFAATCSAGIAVSTSEDELTGELFNRADSALYYVKRENKGGCSLWEES